jgi:hypothetical protein
MGQLDDTCPLDIPCRIADAGGLLREAAERREKWLPFSGRRRWPKECSRGARMKLQARRPALFVVVAVVAAGVEVSLPGNDPAENGDFGYHKRAKRPGIASVLVERAPVCLRDSFSASHASASNEPASGRES